jgi:hypothetical protein
VEAIGLVPASDAAVIECDAIPPDAKARTQPDIKQIKNGEQKRSPCL